MGPCVRRDDVLRARSVSRAVAANNTRHPREGGDRSVSAIALIATPRLQIFNSLFVDLAQTADGCGYGSLRAQGRRVEGRGAYREQWPPTTPVIPAKAGIPA